MILASSFSELKQNNLHWNTGLSPPLTHRLLISSSFTFCLTLTGSGIRGQFITEWVCMSEWVGCQGPDHLRVNPILTGLESDHRVHRVSETYAEVGGQPLIWLKVVCVCMCVCARGLHTLHTCWMTPYAIYRNSVLIPCGVTVGRENAARGLVPSEWRSWLRVEKKKRTINFTSMVTPAEGESVVLHRMRRRNTWRRWSDGYNPKRCLPIHHSVRVWRSRAKPLRWLGLSDSLIGWLSAAIILSVCGRSGDGRQMRRWWWRWKRGRLRGRKTLELHPHQYSSEKDFSYSNSNFAPLNGCAWRHRQNGFNRIFPLFFVCLVCVSVG